MIVRTIRVEGWRCFADPLEIGPFGDGLNVVHGPNGAGKSTLFLALARGMFDKYGAKGEAIRTLRPWGRELNPCVTLHFHRDGKDYRLRKQFLTSARSELHRQENGRFVPLAEGTAADDQVRNLLQGEDRRSGASEPCHWGLAQVLWAPQGELQLGELSAVARQTIQQSLGGQAAGAETTAVEQRVEEMFSRIYTPSGKLRAGVEAPPLVGLQEQLSQARQRREKLLQKLAAFDDAVHRIESLRLQTDQSRRNLEALEAKRLDAQQRAEEYQKTLSEKQAHEQLAAAARAKYEQLKSRIAALQQAAEDVKRGEDTLALLDNEGPALTAQVRLQSQAADRANAAVEEVRSQREAVASAKRLASSAERYTRLLTEISRLEQLSGRIEQATQELGTLTARRTALVAPDAKTLQAITRAARDRDDARLKLDATLITVHWHSEGNWPLEIMRAESTAQSTPVAGEEIQLQGAPDVAFRIPGVGSFRATGPTGSADKLRQQWEAATAKVGQLTLGFGTQDIEQLQQQAAAASELDAQIATARARIDTLLAGRAADALPREQTVLNSQFDAILVEQPHWKEAPPRATGMAEEAESQERQFVERIDAAEGVRKQAEEARSSAVHKLVRHEEALKSSQQQLQSARQRLAQARDDGRSDEQRQQALEENAIHATAAQAKVGELDKCLQQLGTDPRDELQTLQRQAQALRDETTREVEKLRTEEGRLQSIVAEAPYTALGAEEETIADLEDRCQREQLQADAIRLLRDTLVGRKRELIESLVGPVRQRATQTLARITGSRFERLEISDTFDVSGILPRNVSEPVQLDQLSGGEREQAYFAVRLALADIALGGQRQLVVLDDVFTFTDTGRLARIVKILEEAAERFQIVMLTCHPERYRGMPGAAFFDLEEIKGRRGNDE